MPSVFLIDSCSFLSHPKYVQKYYKLCSSKLYLNAVDLFLFMGIIFCGFFLIKFTENYTANIDFRHTLFDFEDRLINEKSTKICAQWIMMNSQYTNKSIQNNFVWELYTNIITFKKCVLSALQHLLYPFKMWTKLICMQLMSQSLIKLTICICIIYIQKYIDIYSTVCLLHESYKTIDYVMSHWISTSDILWSSSLFV